MNILVIICTVISVINVLTFVVYGWDKWRAKHEQWRVPESTLLVMAILGGAFGAWLGMTIFSHKTQHWKFRIIVPLATILWAVGIAYCAYSLNN